MTYIQITSNSGQLSAYLLRVVRQLPEVLDEAVRESAVEAQTMYGATVATLRTQPTFELQHEGTGRWGIKTDSEIYGYVDKGTPPHEIVARRAPYLRFTVPFSPKTKPRFIVSYAGSRGEQWVSKKSVHHPGTKARQFSQIIQQRAQAPTANRLRAALKQATYGSGAGI
jgi:hypothetical protein